MKKKSLFVWLLFMGLTAISQNENVQPFTRAESTLNLLRKVADWQLRLWETEGMRRPKWDWTNATAYTGFMALSKIANDPAYIKAMCNIGKALEWNTGPYRTFADDYCVGQMYSQMHSLYKDQGMIFHFQQLADSIAVQPHNESLEWKNEINLREWAWNGALFMGPPALAYLSTATGERKYLDVADKLWWKTTDYLYDQEENLYYRDSKYFKLREANGKKVFWSRGNGFVMGGLVKMLDNMPENYPGKLRFVELFKKMAAKIASIQQEDGTWQSSLLDPASYPGKEASGTGFYCFALTWGINNGLLPYNQYYPIVEKAWAALVSSVHPDGKVGYVQQIGEKAGIADYNNSDSYGVGAFLLAGSEMVELLLKHSRNALIISLYNSTGLERREEIIELPYEKLTEKIRNATNKKIKIVDCLTGAEILYQLEFRGEKKPANLLLQVSLMPGVKLFAHIIEEKPSAIITKTYARFVPERFDDFTWENDRIAFRMFGTELEKTIEKGANENAYGIDVWSKRTPDFIIDKWYKSADYHTDFGEGLDFYHVGFTLGAGNIAPYINDSIYYSKNYRRYKVLENGPLRSSFQLNYDDWDVNGIPVGVSKIISLDAGSQLNKMEVTYSFKNKNVLPVAVGIVKRPENGNILLDEKQGVMAYWEPQHGNDGTIGVGCITTEPVTEMKVNKDQLLLISNANAQKPFVYYTGAAWDKAGFITTAQQWFKYLENYQYKRQHPVIIEW